MRIFLVLAAFCSALMLDVRPAPAQSTGYGNAPWCAVLSLGTGSTVWDCSYSSIETCRPNVLAGNRGFCNHNPAYTGDVVPQHRAKRYKKRLVHRS